MYRYQSHCFPMLMPIYQRSRLKMCVPNFCNFSISRFQLRTEKEHVVATLTTIIVLEYRHYKKLRNCDPGNVEEEHIFATSN